MIRGVGEGGSWYGNAHGKSKVFNVDVDVRFPIHSNPNAFLDVVP
jgi:hypothetical protein